MRECTEAQTQKLIMDWLQAKGILAFRMQSGAVDSEYKGKSRFMRFGVPGMADILAFPYWRITAEPYYALITPYWIEVKAPKGIQSELQRSFQLQVESHGHRYIIARSLEDVTSLLER